jgi:uncharacterized protein
MELRSVKVKPNAKYQKLEEHEDGSLTAYLKAAPVEGKANAELIQLLAKRFAVPKSSIRIKLGQTSKSKVVEIDMN